MIVQENIRLIRLSMYYVFLNHFIMFSQFFITILKLGLRKFQIGDNQDTCSVEDMYS